MSATPHCLNNAIGLSQTPCDCWTDKPADYNTSDSGLFLDELLPMNNFDGLENCEDTTIWDTMSKARDEAIKRYISDMKLLLLKDSEETYKYFYGKIGEAKGKLEQHFSTNFAGLCLRCRPIKEGYIGLKAIGAMFMTTGVKHIYIMDNLANVIAEYDINTTANVYVNNILPATLQMPLYSENTELLHYYVFYADDAIKPLNNTISCYNCSGFTPCWDMGGKCWGMPVKNSRFDWHKYIQVSGTTFNDLDDLYDTNFGLSSQLYGLTLDIEAYCSIDDMFCIDKYEASPIAMAQAQAIRFKAAEYAISNNILSDKLTRSKLINKESLMAYKAEWAAEYEKYIGFIAENINKNWTSCLKCRDNWKVSKQTAFS